MKRSIVRGVRIVRESYPEPGRPYSLDHFDAAGNPIAELGRYGDLTAAREAFDAEVRRRPQRHLCLRRSACVIARHEPGGGR